MALHTTRPLRHLLAGLAVTVLVFVAGAMVLARQAVGRPGDTVQVASVEPSVTTTPPTTAPPTTVAPTTTKAAPATTTTTVAATTVPPVPTTARPPVTRPVTTAPPVTAAAVAPVVQPSGRSAQERCAAALRTLAGTGLTLPPGWGFRCPGLALEGGVPRWGIACWNCELNDQNWIAVDVGRIGSSDAALRYVVAHETCHANEYENLGLTTELTADLCAALHGAPRP